MKRSRTTRGWLAAGTLCALVVGAGAAWSQPGVAADPAQAERARMASAELRAQLLERENRILQDRIVALQRQVADRGRGATPVPVPAAPVAPAPAAAAPAAAVLGLTQTGPAEGPGARQLALRGALQDFFETGSLVDQTMEVRLLPEGGYLQRQVRYMRTVRDYLRNEGTVAGVIIRDVDRRLALRELVESFLPQNAVYLNAYAMGRLRDQGDAPGFPLALRYLMNSTMLIQEFEILSDPTGQIAAARQFQKQLELERERARGLAEGLGTGVQGAAPARLPEGVLGGALANPAAPGVGR